MFCVFVSLCSLFLYINAQVVTSAGPATIDANKVKTCMPKFEEARLCLKAKVEELKNQAPKVDETALENDIKSCLTANGCTVPDFKKGMDEMKGKMKKKNGPGGVSTVKAGQIMENLGHYNPFTGEKQSEMKKKAQHCAKSMKDNQGAVMNAAKECMKTYAGGADLSAVFKKDSDSDLDTDAGEAISDDPMNPEEGGERIKEKMRGMSKDRKDHMMGVMEKKVKMKIAMHVAANMYNEKICPQANQDGAATCVEEAFNRHVPESMRCRNPIQMAFEMGKKHRDFCLARKNCMASITDDCKTLRDDIVKQKCLCHSSAIISKGSTAFDECMGDTQQWDENGEQFMEFAKDRMRSHWQQRDYDKIKESQELGSVEDGCESGMMPHYDPCDPTSKRKAFNKMQGHVSRAINHHKKKKGGG